MSTSQRPRRTAERRPADPRRRRTATVLALGLLPGLVLPGLALAAPAAADEPDRPQVVVTPDPSYQGQEFEGWGTTLAWFANATGGYPDEIREQLAEMLFGDEGLALNVARYNIGGGNAPDVRDDYMKDGATMPGFWKAPPGIGQEDQDWWDPEDPGSWDWDADAAQRWWVDRVKGEVDTWEAFSNSPPWFQTVSGYVSGGFDPGDDQIRADRVDEFATYLVRVAEEIEAREGIDFASIDPLNEPNTPYWGTTLGPDGQPVGGRQEGAHAGPALQEEVIRALRGELDEEGLDASLSAMDDTSPATVRDNWYAYSDAGRAAVDQVNSHTYGTSARTAVRDLAKAADVPLWMSEVDGTWGAGNSFTDMAPGLGIAERVVNDVRGLEPSAWIMWQAVEDYGPQAAAGKNWGAIQVPFDCTAQDTLETCPVRANTKFDTLRNFTHYIEPGSRFLAVDDTSSVAAVDGRGRSLSVVHVNSSAQAQDVVLDLTAFLDVRRGSVVRPVVTSADGALVEGEEVPVVDGRAVVTVPAESVTTLLVDGVRGVARDASLLDDGGVHRLEGVASGHPLEASQDGAVLGAEDAAAADQLWSFEQVTRGRSNREQYTVTTAASTAQGQPVGLTADDGGLSLLPLADPPAPEARWIASTTGDGTATFVNAATGRLLDVTSAATAVGAPVGTYRATSADNQRWRVVDATVTGVADVEVFTPVGVAPELPTAVTGLGPDGAAVAELSVTWSRPPARRWERPGVVVVRGTATDALGGTHQVVARVSVDRVASTRTVVLRTYPGAAPLLPETVVGVGEVTGGTVDLPVTWAAPEDGAYAELGVVEVPGTAQVPGGGTVPALARVEVVEPVEEDAALEDGTSVAATYTEGGYSTAGLVDGVLTGKAWSNWRPGTKNPAEDITVVLPSARDVSRVVVHTYRDGADPTSPEAVGVQVRTSEGGWEDAGGPVTVVDEGGAPVVEVPLDEVRRTDAVRIHLDARDGRWMTLSEIEVMALTAP